MKIIEVKVTYYMCTYDEYHARVAAEMMCQAGYFTLISRDVTHTKQVSNEDLFHAHQLSSVVHK